MRIIASVAAAALLVAAAAPAEAHGRRWHRHHDDVDAGDVVAGALLVGGLAAFASSINKKRSRLKQDAAVDACAGEAEFRSGGRLSEILHIGKRRGYYDVQGALDADRDGDGFNQTFSCTVRNGRIYSFRLSGGDA